MVPLAGTEEGPVRRQFLLEPAESGRFVPLRVASEAEVTGDAVQGLLVPVGLLPHIQWHERQAERRHVPNDVRHHPVGDDFVPGLAEGSMDQHEFVDQVGLFQVDVFRGFASGAARVDVLQLVARPGGGPLELLLNLIKKMPVGFLDVLSDDRPQLVGTIRDGQLVDDDSNVRGDERRALGPVRKTHLPRHARSHVRVAVSIASHPGGDLDGRGREG
mmetsp:Transcript_9037/g.16813  ORF Transcript_9037/g.16813 Transcript_9037/m.16813 type:complete len:217 (+) Transcript_9037:1599-2249(+)